MALPGTPPTFNPWVTGSGTAASPYVPMQGLQATTKPLAEQVQQAYAGINPLAQQQDVANGRSMLNTLTQRATATTDSPWLTSQLANQQLEQTANMNAAAQLAQTGNQNAYSQMAMRGGLEGGARERIANQGGMNYQNSLQNVLASGALERGGLRSTEEANRLALQQALPGMQLQYGQYGTNIDQSNQNLALQKAQAYTGQLSADEISRRAMEAANIATAQQGLTGSYEDQWKKYALEQQIAEANRAYDAMMADAGSGAAAEAAAQAARIAASGTYGSGGIGGVNDAQARETTLPQGWTWDKDIAGYVVGPNGQKMPQAQAAKLNYRYG